MTAPKPKDQLKRFPKQERRSQYIGIAFELEAETPTPAHRMLPIWTATMVAQRAGVCREAVRDTISTTELLAEVRRG